MFIICRVKIEVLLSFPAVSSAHFPLLHKGKYMYYLDERSHIGDKIQTTSTANSYLSKTYCVGYKLLVGRLGGGKHFF